MNKFIKVLCVILAVLMLVGMATACKKGGEEDEFDILEGGGTVDENGDDTSDDSTDSTDENKGEENKGEGDKDTGTGDDKNPTGNDKNNSGNKEENKAYTKLMNSGKPLPENVYKFDYMTGADYEEFYTLYIPELSDGEYAEAFEVFAELCDDFITQAREGDPYDTNNLPKDPYPILIWMAVSLLVGLVVALIVTGIMRSKLKSVRYKHQAMDYVRPACDGIPGYFPLPERDPPGKTQEQQLRWWRWTQLLRRHQRQILSR